MSFVIHEGCPPRRSLSVDGQALYHVDLFALAGDKLVQLPMVLRILLENAARNMVGEERTTALQDIQNWLHSRTSVAEIAFKPDRLLMHDTTSTPALVDVAAMRDALAEAGKDSSELSPSLPVEISVDHSLAVEAYGRDDATMTNLAHEMRRNAERYRFLRWASRSLKGVHVNPPGTGIMHTINLEQLATVVKRSCHHDGEWVSPDTMLGTDSHTPMINGIGVLGWGVGGLEAQTVMFGMPTMLRIPDVVGVRLTGALGGGASATDLALTVTSRLRAIGVAGDFVEFFGTGVSSLSAGERAVVANMAPEYGATTGYFPIDEQTLRYLRETGRDEATIRLVAAYAQQSGLWFEPSAEPLFTRVVDIDLSEIQMRVAGPRRPQDLHRFGETAQLLAREKFEPACPGPLPKFPVAIAAITSCTNTSDPALLVAAGLLAQKAHARGMKVPAWVKTSLSPGSPAAADYLERSGLLECLKGVGFGIVGFGCATCIGNSGALPPRIVDAMVAGQIRPVAMLSGNRNFPGRVHPDLELGFLMSPALVVAFALAGDAERDLSRSPVGLDRAGRPVHLVDLWPGEQEIAEHVRRGADKADYRRAFQIAAQNPAWHALDAPTEPRFPWDPNSNTLRRPPFAALDAGSLLGRYTARPLLVLGDDVTTDHISPASAIPSDSFIADYLEGRGERRDDLNVFASRRGNWEVMMRAAFYSKSLKNLLAPSAPVGQTAHEPSGDVLPIWQVAERYRREGRAVVLVAGERYGMGSSRDWAAKGQRLLGIRAVLASSYERIHRSNLIGMGIAPLTLPTSAHPRELDLQRGDLIEVVLDPSALGARTVVPVRVLRQDGRVEEVRTVAAVDTALELELLRAGGVIPFILGQYLSTDRP